MPSSGWALSNVGQARDIDGADGPIDLEQWGVDDRATIVGGMLPIGFIHGVRAARAIAHLATLSTFIRISHLTSVACVSGL